mgnify:CR=1 FL=1
MRKSIGVLLIFILMFRPQGLLGQKHVGYVQIAAGLKFLLLGSLTLSVSFVLGFGFCSGPLLGS